jgi:uncharacterized integral membrane protein
MLSKTRGTPAHSPAPGVILDTITTDPVSNGTPAATEPKFAPEEAKFASEHESAASADGAETRAERFRRKALRGRLHGYAVLTIALVAYLIALAASNTAHVKVDWVFGSSQISLVWLVLFTAILGWLLGNLASARFHWRTRAPRRRPDAGA